MYDAKGYSYPDYWKGREYEHASEAQAIRVLIGNKRFKYGLDVGGGYGRLTKLLSTYSVKVDLVEPSLQQRQFAAEFLADAPNSAVLEGDLEDIPAADQSADLIAIFRVIHHVPDITLSLAEIDRVLMPGGYLLLEFANSTHFKARLKSKISGTPIPLTPVSVANDKSVAFVNHHPDYVRKQLLEKGFTIERTLSVSNLRSQGLKQIVPLPVLNAVESFLQSPLGPLHFGPSVILLARKNKT